MSTSRQKTSRLPWIRWFLFSEGLILLLALAGPGSRYTLGQRGDQALLARLIIEEPTDMEAAVINFLVLNLFIGVALFAAWRFTRLRKKDYQRHD